MSLGNVLAVAYATQREKLTFLEEEDKVGTGGREADSLARGLGGVLPLSWGTCDSRAWVLTCQREAVPSSLAVARMRRAMRGPRCSPRS